MTTHRSRPARAAVAGVAVLTAALALAGCDKPKATPAQTSTGMTTEEPMTSESTSAMTSESPDAMMSETAMASGS
jgi:hypothetical protein